MALSATRAWPSNGSLGCAHKAVRRSGRSLGCAFPFMGEEASPQYAPSLLLLVRSKRRLAPTFTLAFRAREALIPETSNRRFAWKAAVPDTARAMSQENVEPEPRPPRPRYRAQRPQRRDCRARERRHPTPVAG